MFSLGDGHGRMHLVERIQEGDPMVSPFEWRRLVDTIQEIIDDLERNDRDCKLSIVTYVVA